jgi:hypothetical protein
MLRSIACRAATAPAALFACLLGLGACAVEPDDSTTVQAVQFQDVVVPSGLKIRDGQHQSYSREEAGWRHARYEYAGQMEVATAANYVRERMPQHGWAKAQDEAGAEATKLRFDRGFYRAEYTFTRSEGATVMVVDYTTDYTRR